ncbi:hypothetical protein AVEN_124603-1 [Araneus ventricosus]|uniref:Tc3 transposase DNA binding domain-containing protein n=1 Tax=Araneus ventricosus TaxID=182803 RepID=A0A4Y2KSN8_ARAVE|nr:hypothetical protein AVEN_124603-1 [Araneus ventricosus]
MSDKCIRLVPASAMAGYQDLSDFECGVIIGARDIGHSISEVAMKFGFSRTTNSRVYREYRVSGKTSNFRHRCGRKKTLKELFKRDRRATLPYIAADFNVGHLQMSACQLFNGPSLIWALRAEGPLVYRC